MKNTTIKTKKSGFTLIELLVVIAIIAILSGLILTSLVGPRAKARDAKRISDVSQIQLALEQYFSKNNIYPDSVSAVKPTYISSIPTDPKTASAYEYAVSSDKYDYALHALLEKDSEALRDGLAAWPSGYSGATATCDGGTSYTSASRNYCVGPK